MFDLKMRVIVHFNGDGKGNKFRCNGQFFSPVSFFPEEKMGRPILSPGKKLTGQFFPPGERFD